MKLTAKIVALFFAAASLLVAASGYLSMQREIGLFQEEMAQRHGELAQAWAAQLRPTVLRSGPESLSLTFESSGTDQPLVRVRWVDRDAAAQPDARPYAASDDLLGLQAGELRSMVVKGEDNAQRYCSYFAIGYSRSDSWFVELSEPFTRRDAYTHGTFLNTIYMLIGLGVIAVLVAGLVGVRLVGRPLNALVSKTERAAEGDLGGPLHIHGGDELSQLAEALNNMCDSLSASQQKVTEEAERRAAAVDQLRHADRLKTVGRLAAGIAHELGTPLNVVAGRAAMIADGRLSEPDTRSSAETIRSEAKRMTSLIEGLLNFARRKPLNRGECRVADVVRSTVPLMESFAAKRSATVATDIAPDFLDDCRGDAAQLQQVISNLVMNAILSKPEGAVVNVRLTNERAADPADGSKLLRDCVVIQVSDDGYGIAKEIRPHLFEPFFTTRDTGEGTGLGLSIVHGIVTEHGGWIEVKSDIGSGSVFSVYLPREE